MSEKPASNSNTLPEVFADGISGIGFYRGVIRFDLVSMELDVSMDPNNAEFMSKSRVIMPLEGFLKSFEGMRRIVAELEKNGVIKNNVTELVDTSADSNKTQEPLGTGSPNFD